MKKFVLSSLALVALSGAALAADLPSKKTPYIAPEPVPVAFSWTGAYVGAYMGGNFASSGVNIPNYPSSFSINSSAFDLGGKIGYNYQINSYVVGLESAFGGTFNNASRLSGGAGGELFRVKQNFAGDIVGKLGFAADRTLFYVKGGVAFANLNNLQFIPDTTGARSNFRAGWTLGAGIDYALTNNWILGIDYAYSDFGKGHYYYTGPTDVHYKTNAVNVSVSYKF
eukprot:gene13284-13394_t